MNSVARLIEFLSIVSEGGEVSDEEVSSLPYEELSERLSKAANSAYEHLLHFAGDEEIRTKNAEYDRMMREGATATLKYLREVLALEAENK